MTCALVGRRDSGDAPLWDRVHRTEHWDVAHAFGTSLEGWLVIVARRHVATVADLDDAAAAELGTLIRDLHVRSRLLSVATRRTSRSSPSIHGAAMYTSTSSREWQTTRRNTSVRTCSRRWGVDGDHAVTAARMDAVARLVQQELT
jgi:hypothetical protein